MDILLEDDKRCVVLTNIIQNLKVFTDNVNIHFNEDSFYIQGMDTSHVSMFDINLDSSWFSKYNSETNLCIGVNLNILSKILSTRTEKQNIHMYYDKVNCDKLNIEFISEESDYNKYFVVPLVDIESDLLEVSEPDYELELNMDSKKFKQLIDQLSSFGESIKFNTENNTLYIETDSEESNMKIEITEKNKDIKSLKIEDNLNLCFNAKFIHNMCMFCKVSENVEIKLAKDVPLQILYKVNDTSLLKIFLAPKINDD